MLQCPKAQVSRLFTRSANTKSSACLQSARRETSPRLGSAESPCQHRRGSPFGKYEEIAHS